MLSQNAGGSRWWALALLGAALTAGTLADWGQRASWAQQTPEAGLADEPATTTRGEEARVEDGTRGGAPARQGGAARREGAPGSGGDDELERRRGARANQGGESTDSAKLVAPPEKQGLSPLARIAIVAAVFIVPILLGHYLSGVLRMPDHEWRIGVALFALVAGLTITLLGWPPKLGLDLRGGAILIYQVDDDDFDMDQLVKEVTQRVNPGGIKEVTVRPYGEQEIQIAIPEADESELRRIEYILSTTGQLEFRILANRRGDDDDIIALATQPQFDNVSEVTDELEGGRKEVIAKWVPVAEEAAARYAGSNLYVTRINKRGEVEVLVKMDPYKVTGDYLVSASPGSDQNGRPAVKFTFDSEGARLFGNLTSRNLPDPVQPNLTRELGIILDRYLRSAPSINERIDREGEITGDFTTEEVENLAAVLTAGRLPATLIKEPTSRLLTGPTLGQDMIDKGVRAMLVSTIVVVVFMLVYYQFAGVVANLALLLNVLLIVAFMILFNAAFTLAGLAGLALTVGMAVDANVLIYERMREELSRGATLRMAIRNGFDRATTTIIDANVTTLISAIVLYVIGTDQVKGFAVTLILGIGMNLFTAITCSRLMFDIAEKMRWVTQLRMLRILSNPNFDFIGKRKAAIALSIVMIGVGLAAVVARGKGLLDIDFTGGTSVEALFEESQQIAYVRKQVEPLPDVTVQDVKISTEPAGKRFLIVTSEPDIDKVKNQLREIFDEPGHQLAFNHMQYSGLERIAPRADARDEQSDPPAEADEAGQSSNGAGRSPTGQQSNRSTRSADWLLAMAEVLPVTSVQASTQESQDDQDDSAASQSPEDQSPDDQSPDDQSPDDQSPDNAPIGEAPEPGPAAPDVPEDAAGAPQDETGAAAGSPADEPADTAEEEAERPIDEADPFAGGTRATLKFSESIDHDTLAGRLDQALSQGGDPQFDLDNPDYEEGITRGFEEWTLRIALPADSARQVLDRLAADFASDPVFPSSNKIGASVASSTQWRATSALLFSLVLIVIYLWFRFDKVSFGFAAVAAVVHDVLVALGGLALSLWLANYLGFLLIEPFKINLAIVAAFLTIIGYSLNDTIVIFDRVRELRGKSTDMSPELINLCINQTLSRTILTSLTVFIVVVILYIFGGQGLHGFAFTLVVGTLSGTYSTIYIAAPILIWLSRPRSAQPGSRDRRIGQPSVPPAGGIASHR